jgi:transposase
MTTTIDRNARTRQDAGAMNDTEPPDPHVPERSAGRRQFSAKYKAKILAEYDTLDRAARGALLRREGLYASLVTTWRQQRDRGAQEALARPAGRAKADPRDRRPWAHVLLPESNLEPDIDATVRPPPEVPNIWATRSVV